MEGFLVVDAGSGSVKTFLVSPEGKIIRSAESLWDREKWTAKSAKPVIIETIKMLKLASSDVQVHGISVTSMREEFVLLDDEGEQVNYRLSGESEKYGNRVLDQYGYEMYKNSGHWPVPNWIAGAILPWLHNDHQDKIEKTRSILMISDWVNHILCGESHTDGTSACETGLYNIIANDWNWDLIEEIGLPSTIFPKPTPNGTYIGSVKEEVSIKADLPKSTPVFLGGADTQCGLLGMGTNNGEVAAVGGTTTPVQLVIDQPIIDEKSRTWTNNHLILGEWIIESNSGYTGRGVRWAKDNLGFKDYADLNMEASEAPIGSNGLLSFLGPHRFNSGPPYWENDKLGDLPVKQGVYGNVDQSRGIQTRSIIESNAYAVKANLLQLSEITGKSYSSLKFCGGNSKSELWMKIQADVLNVPVLVPEVHDGTAIGTAILAACGSGFYSSTNKAIEQMVRIKHQIEPKPSNVNEYENHYHRWMRKRESLSV